MSAPDQRGRRQILAVHTRGVPLAPGVDLDALAAATPGMVGADLKNLVNEAALRAARRGEDQVTMADFSDSLEKIVLGTARGIVLDQEERERTAFHESGHALLGMLTPGADPVRKISIIPRGQALGVTYQAPAADRYGYSETYLRGRITGALGGRAAEEVVYGDVTTGAENDMEHASSIARQMVGRWGMSPAIGPVSVLPLRPGITHGADGVAPATRELVDTETRRIIEECYEQALADPARQPGPAGPAGPHPPGPGDPGRRRSVRRGRHQPRHRPGRDRQRRSARYHHGPRHPPAAAQAGADHIAPAPSR